jgi:hypothetical protein
MICTYPYPVRFKLGITHLLRGAAGGKKGKGRDTSYEMGTRMFGSGGVHFMKPNEYLRRLGGLAGLLHRAYPINWG